MKQIQYIKPNIAYLPELQQYISHGFSWGKEAGNFAYTYGDKVETFQNNSKFFADMDFGSQRKAVLIVPEHKDRIVMIDEEILARKGHKSGINISCDAAFTYLDGVTIAIKIADCQTYYVYGENAEGKSIKGIVHSGWKGTNLLFSEKVIDFLVNVEKIIPKSIKIGLVPGIFQKDRTIQHFKDIEGNIDHWGKFQYFEDGNYYLNSREFTISQLENAGVLKENIYIYDINTFDAAKKGDSFSQKYEYLEEVAGNDVEKGRFIVAMRS